MSLALHPKVYSDIDKIMEYYEREGSSELADDFYSELRHFMLEASKRPSSFSVRVSDVRRANLHRFPYHFLFRVKGEMVKILVVRHNHRHPSFGLRRR